MESKLLIGGRNIMDHTNEQQKMLELKRQEIAEQVGSGGTQLEGIPGARSQPGCRILGMALLSPATCPPPSPTPLLKLRGPQQSTPILKQKW